MDDLQRPFFIERKWSFVVRTLYSSIRAIFHLLITGCYHEEVEEERDYCFSGSGVVEKQEELGREQCRATLRRRNLVGVSAFGRRKGH